MYEYDLAGRINGITTRNRDTNKMQAYESIRYNDGKGTVKSKIYNIYGTDGQLLRQTPYSFTYGDPSKGEIPDALYKLETSGGSYSYAYDRLARLESRTLTVGNTVKTESYTYEIKHGKKLLTTGKALFVLPYCLIRIENLYNTGTSAKSVGESRLSVQTE